MQKKFGRNIVLFLMSFLVISTFFACLKEPTIAPSVVPFSVVRIGNLTTNMDAISVSIDGEFPVPGLQNLQKNTFTEYFDRVAGRRNFVVSNPQTGEVLWEKSVEALSYEEQTMFYSGFYHPSIDTSTVSWISYSDAFTYLSKDPPAGDVTFHFVHAFGDAYKTETDSLGNETVVQDSSRVVNIWATFLHEEGPDTIDVIFEGVVFGDVHNIDLREGPWKFEFKRQDNLDLVASYEGEFSAGQWTWLYATGTPSDAEVIREDKDPLPPRDK